MARVLIVSDSPAIRSGQGRVVRELAQRFHADGVEVAVAGWFDLAAPAEELFDYAVFPAAKEHPESLLPILKEFAPETVVAFGDPWDFAWLSQYRSQHGGFQLVGYLNIEAGPFPLACERIVDGFDVLLTTSAFGASVLNRPGARTVHLGVDSDVFRPVARRQTHLFGRDLSATFTVLLNAQNTYRKNLRAALAGFATFAQGKDDVICYGNTKPNPGAEDADGPNLYEVVTHLGLERVVWFNPDNRGPLDTVPDPKLNVIYGLASVLLVTSIAEGFGLPVLEAQAAGVVPIAPNDYSMPELVGPGGGVLMPVAAHMLNVRGMTVSLVSDDAVAAALEQVYLEWKDDRASFDARVEQGQAFAALKTWDATYRGLRRAMEQTIEPERVAHGGVIDPYVRVLARRAAARHPGAFGVLKLGGLGDMLQTTAVIRAAAALGGVRAVVFCNNHADVFEAMDEVAEVVKLDSAPQQLLLESVADAFPRFLDVRYVSRAYPGIPTAYFERHEWFYASWTASCARLDSLDQHSTWIMLRSLGLDAGDGEPTNIRPVYRPREAPQEPLPDRYVAVATGVGVMGGLKRWPKDRWAELTSLMGHLGVVTVQVGGKEDEPAEGALDYRGLSLPETAYVLEHAELLVGVEGGMVHLAAATGTRAVVIFGPTPVGPFLYPGHVAAVAPQCTPCWQSLPTWPEETCAIGEPACVNFPGVEAVLTHVELLLREPAEVAA